MSDESNQDDGLYKLWAGLRHEWNEWRSLPENKGRMIDPSCGKALHLGTNSTSRDLTCIPSVAAIDLSYLDLRGAHLAGASDLSGSDFTGSDLRGTRTNTGSPLTVSQGTRFIDAKGLFGNDKSQWVDAPVHGEEHAVFARSLLDSLTRWSQLKSFWALRGFAMSWSSLVLMLMYVIGANWYNETILSINRFDHPEAESLYGWLKPIQFPLLFQVQLIAFVLLTVGTTLCRFLCPEIVQENTETAWCDDQKNPRLQYRAADHSRFRWRVACALLYAPGLIYTVFWVTMKVAQVAVILFSLQTSASPELKGDGSAPLSSEPVPHLTHW